MTIAAILETKGGEVVTIRTDQTVADAVALLAEKRIGAVPVLDGDQVVGMFSERDIVYGLQKRGAALLQARVGDVMTAPAVTVPRDLTTLNALGMITRRRIRHLPVVEHGRLVGLVSIGDLVARRLSRMEHEVAAMRDYISGV